MGGLGALGLALALSLPVASLGPGVRVISEILGLHGAVDEMVLEYDKVLDPIEVQGGRLRVLGPRRFDERGPQSCVVMDPEDALDEAELAGCRRATIFRSDRIIDIQPVQRREIRISELQQTFGVGDFRVDSASLAALWARWWWALDLTLVVVALIAASFGWLGLVLRAALLGAALKVASWRRSAASAFATALLVALPIHLVLYAFRSWVWDTGVILHNLAALTLVAPVAGAVWFVSGRSGAEGHRA